MRKLHKSSMCYFHHCSYIGLLCIWMPSSCKMTMLESSPSSIYIDHIFVQLRNWCSDSLIGRHWLLSRGPNSDLIKPNVIVLQVEQEDFTRELVAVVHQWSSNHIHVYNIVIWSELYLLLKRPKIQRKQYPLFVTMRILGSSWCLWINLNVFLLELMCWCCGGHWNGWMVR